MMLKKKAKELDKEDLGFQEEIQEEGFIEEPIEGAVVKTFEFSED